MAAVSGILSCSSGIISFVSFKLKTIVTTDRRHCHTDCRGASINSHAKKKHAAKYAIAHDICHYNNINTVRCDVFKPNRSTILGTFSISMVSEYTCMETIIGTARPIHPSSWGLIIAVVFAVRSVCTFVYMDAYAANAPSSVCRTQRVTRCEEARPHAVVVAASSLGSRVRIRAAIIHK